MVPLAGLELTQPCPVSMKPEEIMNIILTMFQSMQDNHKNMASELRKRIEEQMKNDKVP